MENEGLGVRGWGLWVPLVTALASTLATLCVCQERLSESEQSQLRFTVRIVSYAPVSHKELEKALKEAALLFARVDVEMQWVLCRVSSEDGEEPAECATRLRPGAFALRILPGPKRVSVASNDSLGFAIIVPGARDNYLASLFYNRVEGLAEDAQCPRAVVLGHAMAHELGHLLLGTPEHSPQGLMRAHWDAEDLRLAQRRSLPFTSQQAALIRAALSARLRVFADWPGGRSQGALRSHGRRPCPLVSCEQVPPRPP